MTEKKLSGSRFHPSGKNVEQSGQKRSEISRRKFIQIGAATLATSIVGGMGLKLLFTNRKRMGSIKASFEKPNKNPAFVAMRGKNGSMVCYARLPGGKVIKHELNSVGAAIYLACDGARTRQEIIRQAATELAKDTRAFLPEARQFLLELEKQNLIVTTGKVNLFYKTEVRYEQA